MPRAKKNPPLKELQPKKPPPQQLPANYDYRQCFGIRTFCEKLDPECYLCEYIHACSYAAREKKPDGRQHLVSYEQYCFSRDIADESELSFEIEYDTDTDTEPVYTHEDMLRLLEYILNIDEYSLSLVIDMLAGNAQTTADLARMRNVSRQAIHRKLIDSCDRYPELKELLMGNLYRCKRILRGNENYGADGVSYPCKRRSRPYK